MVDNSLPEHPHRRYEPANACVYCGSTDNLHDEHIIPYALGGRWILPDASCADCGKKTSAFEGTCARTILGPLRMLHDVQSRRKKARPNVLPLKVRRDPNSDWTTIDVPRGRYPFLVVLPLYPPPEELSQIRAIGKRDASTDKLWLRGACGKLGMQPHLESLARQFGVSEIMPTGDIDAAVFCLMLAKIAHSFAVAELGSSLEAFLPRMIRERDISNRVQFIGGSLDEEPPSKHVHEVSLIALDDSESDIIVVRIRLFACLGTPTYFVAAGRRAAI